MEMISIEKRRLTGDKIAEIINWLRATQPNSGYAWNSWNDVWNLRVVFSNTDDLKEFEITWCH